MELKPCMVCESDDLAMVARSAQGYPWQMRVQCINGHYFDCWSDTDEEAAELWNTRPIEARQQETINELVAALEEAMSWNWLDQDMPEDIYDKCSAALAKAKENLNE